MGMIRKCIKYWIEETSEYINRFKLEDQGKKCMEYKFSGSEKRGWIGQH